MLQRKNINSYPALKEKLVLSVDDNEMNQLVISKILQSAGIKTVSAYNGAEAVKLLSEGLIPDVILMDLEMPVMNGLQTSEFIRKQMTSNIPIIINSGLVSGFQKYKLHSLGITEYLEKPYSMNDILSKLSKNVSMAA